jgi:peptide/nickel transport system substrate-binding protein
LLVPLALALVAGACGDDDDDDDGGATDTTAAAETETSAAGTTAAPATTPSTIATPSTEEALEADPDGEIRIGWDLTAINGIDLDPGSSDNITDFQFHDLIYDSPLRVKPEGGYEPSLAESYEIVDPRTISVTLQDDLVYSDGSPLTADDVVASVTRYQDGLANQRNNLNPRIAEIESVEVTSPTEFTIHLASDTAGDSVDMLANREFVIQPAAQTAEQAQSAPIGAGPFKVVSYTQGQELVLEKNESYYAADDVMLARIRFIHVDSAAIANALQGDVIDLHVNYPPSAYAGIEDDDSFTSQVLASDSNFIYMGICKEPGATYESKEVRQAILKAIDRDEVNEGAYDGLGEPMTQMWPRNSQYYDADVAELAAYDPDAAATLLEQSGVTDLTVRAIVISNQPLHNDAALIVGSQLEAIGATLEVVPTQDIVGDFFQGRKEQAVLTGWVRPGLQKVTRMFGANSVANVCNYQDPTIDGLVATIASIDPNSDEAIDAWKELSRHIMEEALFIPLDWEPQIVVFKTDTVAGLSQVYPARAGVNLRGVFVPA